MRKIKRKARTQMSKDPKFNALFPIPLEAFGSEDDPCYAKHHDPGNSTCQRCGDNELCQIRMTQLNNTLRDKEEKKGNFKDLEEKEIYDSKKPKVLNKIPAHENPDIRKAIRRKLRKYGEIKLTILAKRVNKTFPDITSNTIELIIMSMSDKSTKFTLKKGILKWIG